jgi:hypothetical protein
LKALPDWPAVLVLYRVMLTGFFGGGLMMIGQVILSRRYNPNRLSVKRRLELGKRLARPLEPGELPEDVSYLVETTKESFGNLP